MGTDDVTDKFYDTESQLRLLRYEQERLENYLKKLEDVDKILRTESRLTEIRHDIESLTGTLNKLNDLVELSTITINMNEKAQFQVIIKSHQHILKGLVGVLQRVQVMR